MFDSDDHVRGAEYCLGELLDVEPFQGRSFFDQPEIRIEAVDINDCVHKGAVLKAKAAPLRPLSRQHAAVGLNFFIAHQSFKAQVRRSLPSPSEMSELLEATRYWSKPRNPTAFNA